MQITRRAMLGGLAAGLAGPAFGQATQSVAAAEDLVRAAALGGDVCYQVADMRTGLVLEARAGDRPMPPASTVKAIT
ncbi:MAG: D-alanyl-D-alanine carboxypeptidase, partial [Rhodobacteraceae bacterium]|nr:D-alanyl-D-alanine carboxypeptidase [Paracoccaceae bacterium]